MSGYKPEEPAVVTLTPEEVFDTFKTRLFDPNDKRDLLLSKDAMIQRYIDDDREYRRLYALTRKLIGGQSRR